MNIIQQQVQRARRRLWLATWLEVGCRVACWALAVFAVCVLVARSAGWPLPTGWVALGLAGAGLVMSLVWAARTAPNHAASAARLDAAAGLRERVSSSLYCTASEDAFAQAVQADAECRAAGITVRQHLRLSWPQRTGWAVCAAALAAAVFLVPPGWLRGEEARSKALTQSQVVQTRVEIKKQLDAVRQQAEALPAMADLRRELDKLDENMLAKLEKPADVRQEAIKKLDRLADTVRERQQDTRFDKVEETKRMLRALEEPAGEESLVQKFAEKLQDGDFESAAQELQKMQQKLAQMREAGNTEELENLQTQLDQLAQQLDQLASQEELKQQLAQSGLSREEIERMLQQLTPQDMERIREMLQKSGMSQQKINQICKQCKKQQGACQGLKKLSQSLKSACSACKSGDPKQAAQQLGDAAAQLSEMQQMQQEMQQLQSAIAMLEAARNECQASGQTSQNPSFGPGSDDGQGPGIGEGGHGDGQLANAPQAGQGFKLERGQVTTTKGRIAGQFLIDGEPLAGDTTDAMAELITAAEQDATDTVNQQRLPRQYEKSVRDYFSQLPGGLGIGDAGGANASAGESDATGTGGNAAEPVPPSTDPQ